MLQGVQSGNISWPPCMNTVCHGYRTLLVSNSKPYEGTRVRTKKLEAIRSDSKQFETIRNNTKSEPPPPRKISGVPRISRIFLVTRMRQVVAHQFQEYSQQGSLVLFLADITLVFYWGDSLLKLLQLHGVNHILDDFLSFFCNAGNPL